MNRIGVQYAATFFLATMLAFPVALAQSIRPSDLASSQSTAPVLTLVQGDETRTLSLADIETLGLYEAELEHFEGLTGVFTGVRLEAFVEQQGLDGARRLRFIAADDYTVFLRPEVIDERDMLLVTRFGGDPIPRTQLGPLMLVIPDEAEAVLDGEVTPTDWIWALTEIHAQ